MMSSTYETKKVFASDYIVELFIDHFNERIRIDYYRGNMTNILIELEKSVEFYSIKKVIFYSRPEHWQQLISNGFELEAIIKGYFNGTDNYIMTLYKDNDRRISKFWVKEDEILRAIYDKQDKKHVSELPKNYYIRRAEKQDAKGLADLYKTVFSIYPTPMNDAAYIEKVLEAGVIFFVVECEGKLVSAASAERNELFHNAEITDCATLQEHRKYGLMKKLIFLIEEELKNNGIYCVYSIARALSFGMNAAFHQLGYTYQGRLTNNCYIFDKLEDMNIWVKDLANFKPL